MSSFETSRNSTNKHPRLSRDELTFDVLCERGGVVWDSTGCAKWTAARTRKGYGVINLKNEKTQYAHRLAFDLTHGGSPEAVMHSCDTPMCINPSHIQAGTVAENNADAASKGLMRGRHSKPRRATWDETWLGVAQVISQRSRCVRRAAGCVIVTSTNQVVATGFNGPPAGYIHREAMCTEFCPRSQGTQRPMDYDDCVASHAEINALMMSERSRHENGYAYITTSPCYDCAKALANSGLRGIKTRVLPQDWYREPPKVLNFIMECNVEVEILP